MNGFQKDITFSLMAISMALVTGAVAFGYPTESSYFPRTLAVFLGLMALLFFARVKFYGSEAARTAPAERHKAAAAEERGAQIEQLKAAALVFGSIAAYVGAIKLVNYEISTVVFLAAVMVYLGYRNLIWIAAVSVGLTAFLYGVFIQFLGVVRPESVWF